MIRYTGEATPEDHPFDPEDDVEFSGAYNAETKMIDFRMRTGEGVLHASVPPDELGRTFTAMAFQCAMVSAALEQLDRERRNN